MGIKRHKSSLNAALVRMKIKMGVVNNKDLLPDSVKDEGTTLRALSKGPIKPVVSMDVYSF